MLPLAQRKNTPTSSRRPHALSLLTAKRCYFSTTLVVFCWIMEPETVFAGTRATCEQTYGYLGANGTLRCTYEPFNTSITFFQWKKGHGGNNIVYIHVPSNTNKNKAFGDLIGRNVTTKDGVTEVSGFHDMNIPYSIVKDENTYECNLITDSGDTVIAGCPRLTLAIPPSMFNLSYVDGGSNISVPERNTDCTTGGITISTNGITTLRYVTASRPNSTITWNQVTDGSREHTPLSDNTIRTTFEGHVTVKQGDTKLVKFTITSQNPNFKARPLVKEACIKVHHAGGSTPPGHKPGELAAIIVGSLAAVALISGGVALAMWKMRLACWKNTANKVKPELSSDTTTKPPDVPASER